MKRYNQLYLPPWTHNRFYTEEQYNSFRQLVHELTVILMYSHVIINPIIYQLYSNKFRIKAKQMLLPEKFASHVPEPEPESSLNRIEKNKEAARVEGGLDLVDWLYLKPRLDSSTTKFLSFFTDFSLTKELLPLNVSK